MPLKIFLSCSVGGGGGGGGYFSVPRQSNCQSCRSTVPIVDAKDASLPCVSKQCPTNGVWRIGTLDDCQITHLICVRLRHLLYDFFRAALGSLYKKTNRKEA